MAASSSRLGAQRAAYASTGQAIPRLSPMRHLEVAHQVAVQSKLCHEYNLHWRPSSFLSTTTDWQGPFGFIREHSLSG
jgi:hypothetical protein